MAQFFEAAQRCNVTLADEEDSAEVSEALVEKTVQETGASTTVAQMYYDMKARGILLDEVRHHNVKRIVATRVSREEETRKLNAARAEAVRLEKERRAATEATLRTATAESHAAAPNPANGSASPGHPRSRCMKVPVPSTQLDSRIVFDARPVDTEDGPTPSAAIATGLVSPMVLSFLTTKEQRAAESVADDTIAPLMVPPIDFHDPFLPFLVEEQRERAVERIVPRSITALYTSAWAAPAAEAQNVVDSLREVSSLLTETGKARKKNGSDVAVAATDHSMYRLSDDKLRLQRELLVQERQRLSSIDSTELADTSRFRVLRDVERQRVLSLAPQEVTKRETDLRGGHASSRRDEAAGDMSGTSLQQASPRHACLTSTMPSHVDDRSVLHALQSVGHARPRTAHPIDLYQSVVRRDLLSSQAQNSQW